ncbi:hypothetical protein ETAA8_24490 [Anatilimnocola aggregata]|uniref:Uncharacterized protein n=1 Tax=Anatilimnocola aggregata TaxID=2528021 RepID=A0A517YB59_9BACT|nr:hypothetical protein [Anatilimnocola aggregata]QDU27362.1 hypothetical protein ETAA8_24490 [Anatilimnocola aggregata]
MSFDPNDPNWQRLNAQQPPPGHYQNYPPQPYRRPQRNNTIWYVLGGFALLGLLTCGLCCGAVALAPPPSKQASGPLGFLASQAQLNQLKSHPDIRQHIGDITKLSINLTESAGANQGRIGKKAAVYDITGTKGKGYIIGPVDEGWGKERRFISAILVMPDETSYVIVRP